MTRTEWLLQRIDDTLLDFEDEYERYLCLADIRKILPKKYQSELSRKIIDIPAKELTRSDLERLKNEILADTIMFR